MLVTSSPLPAFGSTRGFRRASPFQRPRFKACLSRCTRLFPASSFRSVTPALAPRARSQTSQPTPEQGRWRETLKLNVSSNVALPCVARAVVDFKRRNRSGPVEAPTTRTAGAGSVTTCGRCNISENAQWGALHRWTVVSGRTCRARGPNLDGGAGGGQRDGGGPAAPSIHESLLLVPHTRSTHSNGLPSLGVCQALVAATESNHLTSQDPYYPVSFGLSLLAVHLLMFTEHSRSLVGVTRTTSKSSADAPPPHFVRPQPFAAPAHPSRPSCVFARTRASSIRSTQAFWHSQQVIGGTREPLNPSIHPPPAAPDFCSAIGALHFVPSGRRFDRTEALAPS